MRKFLIVLVLFLFVNNTSAQNSTEMAFYNIGLGSVVSGVGALINKKPNEKWNQVLFKGMWQGAAGGYLVYQSKRLVGEIPSKKEWTYGWAAKIVNSAGISMIENASLNKDFWVQWNINFGFNRLEFHTKNRLKIKYKISPVGFIETGISSFLHKFEFQRTLQTGEFIFSHKDYSIKASSYAYLHVIIMNPLSLDDHSVISHEMIHIYQYNDFNFFNTYLNKPFNKWEAKSKTFKNLSKIFYFDLQAPLLRGLYSLENINRSHYYDNFFEGEAHFYSKD